MRTLNAYYNPQHKRTTPNYIAGRCAKTCATSRIPRFLSNKSYKADFIGYKKQTINTQPKTFILCKAEQQGYDDTGKGIVTA
jgi:hypothetical protein